MGEGCDLVCLHCFVLTLYSYFFNFLFEWREDLYAHVQLSGTSFFITKSFPCFRSKTLWNFYVFINFFAEVCKNLNNPLFIFSFEIPFARWTSTLISYSPDFVHVWNQSELKAASLVQVSISYLFIFFLINISEVLYTDPHVTDQFVPEWFVMDPLGLCSPGGGGRTVCWESRGTQTTPARCPVSPLPLSRHRGSRGVNRLCGLCCKRNKSFRHP